MAGERPVRLGKRIERAAGGIALRFMAWLARLLPSGVADGLGRFFGRLWFRFDRKHRNRALSNLRMCFPEWRDKEVRDVARRTFEHFGKTSIRFLRGSKMRSEEVLSSVNAGRLGVFDAALAEGKGALLITAHFGNWERLAHFITSKGYALSVIARDTNDPRSTEMMNEIRQAEGLEVFSRGSAAREVLRRLGRNEIVGILPDQNAWNEPFVPFFGKPAGTVAGPAVFHLRTGAPLISAFCAEVDGGYAVEFKRIELPETTGDRDADVLRIMTVVNSVIEQAIREQPQQWLWMHDRWRSARVEGLLDDAD